MSSWKFKFTSVLAFLLQIANLADSLIFMKPNLHIDSKSMGERLPLRIIPSWSEGFSKFKIGSVAAGIVFDKNCEKSAIKKREPTCNFPRGLQPQICKRKGHLWRITCKTDMRMQAMLCSRVGVINVGDTYVPT